ncbi:MAG: DUF938 domain-containing protein [Thiothrix sp.]|nr:DUF938 domain-containing protein [Thiothrix sp.]HPQ96979.1 DUF938 domain-containing protein [Thiolinea sp.]
MPLQPTQPRPFAESCEQNRDPILAVLRRLFADRRQVLEIGSGTGQHAVYFARYLPWLFWQTSDQAEHHPGIRAWLTDAALPNTGLPLLLDVRQPDWPALAVDAVFSANTLHIMSWPAVEACFAGVGRLLPAGGQFAVYGPFNYGGEYTSAGNARFDQWLQQRDPASGVRNFEDLAQLAQAAGLHLREDVGMPANNRMLCWEKAGWPRAVPSGMA